MNFFKINVGAIKFVCFLTLLITYMLLGSFIQILFFPKFLNNLRLKTILTLIHLYARLSLRLLQVKVEKVHLTAELHHTQGQFIVCNHLSYLDVLVLFAQRPARFVTSHEIRETPGLGFITQLAGCFFVERRKERRSLEQLQEEMQQLREALKKNQSIVIFPEGTSTRGDVVLPFKSTFFQIPIDLKITVTPMVINYVALNQSGFNQKNADLVCWYGDMDFLPHLRKLCALQSIEVQLTRLPSLPTQDVSRNELSACAQAKIAQHYESIRNKICDKSPPEISGDKRRPHDTLLGKSQKTLADQESLGTH
jgi:1-acyl-sn-glycerol-3-phosphate acyltransferase